MLSSKNLKIKKNNRYEILTSEGFKNFKGVTKGLNKTLKLFFSDDKYLECTYDHKIIIDNGYNYKFAKDLLIGDEVISKDNKKIKLINKIELNEEKDVFEIIDVDDVHSFYCNDILQKNCLLLDEFAFVPDNIADEFMTSVYPTIVSGKSSKIIITSCVVDTTYVFTNKGIKQIKNFIDYNKKNGYEVAGYNVYGKEKLNKGNIFHNDGKCETNIIESTSSYLECSNDHKLWACKKGIYGWFKSSELNVGDYISIKYGMDVWGSNDDICFVPNTTKKHKNVFQCKKITKEISYFLGLFIAEGYARKHFTKGKFISGQVIITCGDDVSKYLKELGLKFNCTDGIHYVISSKTLIEFIDYLGFDINKKAKDKIIPDRLLEISRENIIHLIRGIFDGDGF